MSRYDSDGLRRVSPHLRAGVGGGHPRAGLHDADAAGAPPGSARPGRIVPPSGRIRRHHPGAIPVAGDLAEAGRWLEEFHPYSLVELDYGGLVHLVSDDALCGDQSVAEIRAAIDGAARGEHELAVAMYMRARNRWRAFAEFELAN